MVSDSLVFRAKKISTGEECLFRLEDLYGYEGEVCGVLIYEPNWLIGSTCDVNCGFEGMNPDIEITLESAAGWERSVIV